LDNVGRQGESLSTVPEVRKTSSWKTTSSLDPSKGEKRYRGEIPAAGTVGKWRGVQDVFNGSKVLGEKTMNDMTCIYSALGNKETGGGLEKCQKGRTI